MDKQFFKPIRHHIFGVRDGDTYHIYLSGEKPYPIGTVTKENSRFKGVACNGRVFKGTLQSVARNIGEEFAKRLNALLWEREDL